MLFALALHRVVRPLAERLKREPLGWSVWYHDDGTFLAKLETLEELAGELEGRLPTVGLALNKTKTVIACSQALDPFPRLQQFTKVDLSASSEGIRVLGVPLGGADFVQGELKALLQKVQLHQLLTLQKSN